jgi:hypothetical protein
MAACSPVADVILRRTFSQIMITMMRAPNNEPIFMLVLVDVPSTRRAVGVRVSHGSVG